MSRRRERGLCLAQASGGFIFASAWEAKRRELGIYIYTCKVMTKNILCILFAYRYFLFLFLVLPAQANQRRLVFCILARGSGFIFALSWEEEETAA